MPPFPVSNRIVIKNVGRSADESDVRQLLRKYNPSFVKLMSNRIPTGPNVAIASFDSPEIARSCIAELNGFEWADGMFLTVDYSENEQPRQVPNERAAQLPSRVIGNSIPPPEHAHSYWGGGPPNQMRSVVPPMPRHPPANPMSGVWDEGLQDEPPLQPERPPSRGAPIPRPPRPSPDTVDADDFFGGDGAPRSANSSRVPFYSSEVPTQQPSRKVTFEEVPPPKIQFQPQPLPPSSDRMTMVRGDGYMPQEPIPAHRSRSVERMGGPPMGEMPFEEMNRPQLIEAAYRLKEENSYLKQLVTRYESERSQAQQYPPPIPQPAQQQQWRQPSQQHHGSGYGYGPSGPAPSEQPASGGNRFQFDFDQAGGRPAAPPTQPPRRSLEGANGYEETPTTSGLRGGRGAGGNLGTRAGPTRGGFGVGGYGNDEQLNTSTDSAPNGGRFGGGPSGGGSSRFAAPAVDDARNEQTDEPRQPREPGAPTGGFGGMDRQGDRRLSGGERPPRRESGGFDGPPRRESGGFDGPPRRESGGFDGPGRDKSRERGEGGFEEGGNRRSFGERRDGGFGERREGGFGDRGGRREGGSGGGNSCYKCGESGHFARECPKAGESTGGDRGPRRDGCFNCGGSGHMSRDCPQPRGGGNRGPPRSAPAASSSKGMVDDEFAEPTEQPSTVEPALERPAQGGVNKMIEEEEEVKKPEPAKPTPPAPTPAPVPSQIEVKVSPPAEIVEKPPTTVSQPAPKARFNLPMMPKLGGSAKPAASAISVPPPAPAPVFVAPVTPAVPDANACANCAKPLSTIIKNCPECEAPLCSNLTCFKAHVNSEICVQRSHQGTSDILSPDVLRRKEAEKQVDAWKEALDQVEINRFEKLARRKPILVTVVNFKNPHDFWVVEKSQLDGTLYKMNLPNLALNAPVISESSRDPKSGLLAYSTIPLKPLVRGKHLLVAPSQRTVDNLVDRSGEVKEVIFEHGDFVRCIVLSVNYDTKVAQVFSLDGAFEAEVPAGALRYADETFKNLPVRAIHCTMSPFLDPPALGSWASPEEFASLCSKQYWAIFGDVIDGKVSSQLADTQELTFVADKLLRNKLVSSKSISDAATIECPKDGSHSFNTPHEWLIEKGEFTARFAKIRSLDDFSLMVCGSTEPGKLVGSMCRFYDTMPSDQSLKHVERGQLVVVGRRGSWDRGVWKSGQPGSSDSLVELVDSGQKLTSTKDVSVFPLRYQFLVPPAIGVSKCRLQEGIINSIDHLDKDVITAFITLVADRNAIELRLVAKETEKNEPALVVNFIEAKFHDQLVAMSKRPLVIAGLIESYVNIDSIYPAMILETGRKVGKMLEAKVSLIGSEYEHVREVLENLSIPNESRRKVPRPALYQACLRVTRDEEGGEMVSRVKVLGKGESSEKVRVEVIDTAEIEEVPINELIESTREIADLKRLALRCKIELSQRDEESIAQFQTLDLKASYQDGWVFKIRRFLMDQNPVPKVVIDGNEGRGIVYNVNDPYSIYVLVTAHEDLEVELQSYAEQEPARYVDGSALVSGELCVAKFEEVWYRAVIREGGANPRVLFIDYGNEAVIEHPTEELRPFKDTFFRWPLQGVVCQLASVLPTSQNGAWPQEAIDHLKSTICDQPVAFTIVNEGLGGEEIMVRLIREEDELDVAGDLISNGLARKG